jgi:EAL domain-containing protein (putative c-di-GMP-specific phosphodiesterase class I)/GGDEF domain-containing protein
MSLKRQVTLAGAMIFALALIGVAVGQWLSGREFVREQLAAHAQETATALSLSLTTALREGDAALVRTTLLPIFDRGYYRRIVIRDVSGAVVDAVEAAASPTGVPRWFAALAQLEPPRAEALVSAGWRQAGRVEVEGDAEFALRQLWHGTLRSLAWLLAVYVLALSLMLAWLRRLLAPMAAVERIAAAAAGRRIAPIMLETRVRELASFIAGFNRLAGMVNSRLAEEEARAERFRSAALTDRLTGLPNRLGLETALADGTATRWLGLVAADGVEAINRSQGYEAGDAFVAAMAECVRDAFPAATVARLHATTFAVALEDGEEDELRHASEGLLAAMSRRAAGHGGAPLIAAAGWTVAATGEPLSATLAAADQVLASAQADGRGQVSIRRDAAGAESALGARALLQWVDAAIAAGSHALSWQTVVSVPAATPIQTEVYLRLRGPDGQMVPAQRFLPLVRRERDASFLDRAMFERLRQAVDGGRIPPGSLAANIAADTFRSGALPGWLAAGLARWPATHPLVLELREGDVVAAPAAAERFGLELRSRGVALALDHFGTHAGGIAAMRLLLPQYVKLDASLSLGLDAIERRFQVEALVRAAHSLEVPVWAQVFDSPGALELLAEMGIVGAQGYTLASEQAIGG